jgi:hypothetical protein
MREPPREFASMRGGQRQMVPIVVRNGVASARVQDLIDALDAVDWSALNHAYGPAVDVPTLLFAVDTGTDDVRAHAWWELWGNIHHQGTVYEATLPTVPFIEAIARTRDHPDRVEALSFLREIARGDGQHSGAVREAVRPIATALVSEWSSEPEIVQRALLWLAVAFPELVPACSGLVEQVPPSLRLAWDEQVEEQRLREVGDDDALEARYADDNAGQRRDVLEGWALAGWPATNETIR